jgi:hypothetical protein
MEYTKIGAPRFDGQNYAFFNKMMKTFLQEHGFDVWHVGFTSTYTCDFFFLRFFLFY